jgi:hypothetical protein
MATVANIADRAQNAMNDAAAGTWSQAIVEEWICEGIRDYNLYFRRTVTESLSILNAVDTRTLSRLCREVIHVEYPTGDDPPTYLHRKNRYAADFYDADDNFDFEPVGEFGLKGEDVGNSPYLIFSFTLTAGETLTVLERAIHDAELDSGDQVTVPDEHQHLLILFTVWKAHSERVLTEAQNPDTTIRMINQMKQAAQMAEQDYRRAVKQAVETTAQGGWTAAWRMDKHDRIY